MFDTLGAMALDPVTAELVKPVAPAHQKLLPVPDHLAPLLPHRGLQRGTVVTVRSREAKTKSAMGFWGSTTLAFSLLSALPSDSWQAAIGIGDLGPLALVELGINLDHLLLVPHPGHKWPEVTSTLLQGTDVVVLCPLGRVSLNLAGRLAAKAREQGSVLIVLADRAAKHTPKGANLGKWSGWPPGEEVSLSIDAALWVGAGRGEGHLRGRLVHVTASGRRGASRPTSTRLWMPTPARTWDPETPGRDPERERNGERGG